MLEILSGILIGLCALVLIFWEVFNMKVENLEAKVQSLEGEVDRLRKTVVMMEQNHNRSFVKNSCDLDDKIVDLQSKDKVLK